MNPILLQTPSPFGILFGLAFLVLVALVWDLQTDVERQTEQLERIESHLSEVAADEDDEDDEDGDGR